VEDEPDDALANRAFRLLARRDRSRAEMRTYLARYCSDADRVSALLTQLQERGWLCEERLAEQLIRKNQARTGTRRTRQEMARRGIASDVIERATAGLEREDLATALALWRKKFGRPPADQAERLKQLRYLLNRGFGHATALKVLRAGGEMEEPVDDV
jgi:regulatory protein